jgi:hypothetical protein
LKWKYVTSEEEKKNIYEKELATSFTLKILPAAQSKN